MLLLQLRIMAITTRSLHICVLVLLLFAESKEKNVGHCLLTFNTGLTPNVARYTERRSILPTMVAVTAEQERPDFMCIQELWQVQHLTFFRQIW